MLYSFDREHQRTTYMRWQRGSIQKKEYSIWKGGRAVQLWICESINNQLNLVKLICSFSFYILKAADLFIQKSVTFFKDLLKYILQGGFVISDINQNKRKTKQTTTRKKNTHTQKKHLTIKCAVVTPIGNVRNVYWCDDPTYNPSRVQEMSLLSQFLGITILQSLASEK